MPTIYKQETAPTADTPAKEPIAVPTALPRKELILFLLTGLACNSLVTLFTRLARKATGLPEWLIFPLAILSALSVVLFFTKWFWSRKKA